MLTMIVVVVVFYCPYSHSLWWRHQCRDRRM